MGSQSSRGVKPRSKKSIQLTFHYKGVRCRETINLPATPRNLNHCKTWKARIEHEIATNTFDYKKHFPNSDRLRLLADGTASVLTIRDYLTEWLKAEKPRIKYSTWVGYTKILKYNLIPAFGHLALNELRRKHLYEWADGQTAMSAKRARNILSPLRIALNAAIKRELLDQTPFAGFKLEKKQRQSEEVDPFNSEERAAILNVLDGQHQNLILFAFWTGLRTSELVALDWRDIDWVHGLIMVRRTMTQGMTAPEQGTKTAAGFRQVKLLTPALHALTEQKRYTYLKGAEVFQRSRTGERWPGDKAIRESLWIPALKKAGVRYRNPYQTRHTFASMMLNAKESVLWVAAMMGHTDWSLTAKRYARWIPSDMPQAGTLAVEQWWTPQLCHNTSANH